MKKYQIHDHYPSTIITTKRSIKNCLRECDHTIVRNAVFCTNTIPDYDIRLWYVCSTLEWLCRMYYKSHGRLVKMSAHKYYKELFEGCAETEEEVNDIYPVTTDVFDKLHTVFKIWSHCLAIDNESVFAGEFAYAYEFVMKYDNLPEVKFSSKNSLYPDNYPCYNASEHRWFHHDFLDHLADAD